jgi:hypothetical protein
MTSEDRNPAPVAYRLLYPLAAAGLAMLMLAFARPLFLGRIFTEDDLSAFHLPLRAFYHRCLEQGDSFLWMPSLFNGFFVHGEGQAGMLHPLHYLLYRFLPLDVGFMLDILLSYPLAAAGMYFFLRRWRLDRHAAIFGGLLFSLLGFCMNHYVHMHFVAILAHVPWLLLAIDVAMRANDRRQAALATACVILLTASQILQGIPQATYFSWLIELVYALYLLTVTRRLGVLLALGAAKALAILLCGAQLLPTLDALGYSTRANPDLQFQLSISMRPLNLIQLLNPYLFHRRVYGVMQGDEPWDAPYLGAAATVLLLLVVLRLRHLRRLRPLAVFGLLLTGFGLLAALGKYGFLYHVFALIPVVNKLRAPARYVAIAHVGLAIVAAVGLAHLSTAARDRRPLPWRSLGSLAAVPALSFALAAGLFAVRHFPGTSVCDWANLNFLPMRPVLLGVAFMAAAAALVMAAGRGKTLAIAGILLLTFADVSLYSLRHKPAERLDTFLNAIELPPVPPHMRIEPDVYPATMNLISLKGYSGPSGYVSMIPRQHLDYSQDLPLRMAGVCWRETRYGTSLALNAAKDRGEKWLALPDPLPRARLVSNAVVSDDPNRDIHNIDVANTALVGIPLSLPPGPPGDAHIISERPGDIRISVHTDVPRMLVLTESFHRGWRVTVDGVSRPMWPVYGDFMGCEVKPGDTGVHFLFDPPSYRLGKRLSLLGLALSVFFIGGWLVISPRGESRSASEIAALRSQ